MPIVRGPRPTSNYYVLDKRISEDRRLSWAARGILIFLLGKPDHWEVSISALIEETTGAGPRRTGRDGVYAILRELLDAGYLRRQQPRNGAGRVAEVDYIVSESPLPAEPYTAEPDLAEPHPAEPYPANPTQAITDVVASKEKEQRQSRSRERAHAKADPPPGVKADVWAEWLTHRGKLTPVALARQRTRLANLAAAGHDPNDVIAQSIERGWAGLFAIDVSRRERDRQAPPVNPVTKPNGSRPKFYRDAAGNVRDADGKVIQTAEQQQEASCS
jgi:hypothetical protein